MPKNINNSFRNSKSLSLRDGLRRWFDMPTLVVGCCWVGMLLLWADLSVQERDIVPRYKSMVIAHNMRFSDEDMYRRPDLVTMPSSVSFVPDFKDVENIIVSTENDPYISTLKRAPLQVASVLDLDKVALAAEAIRDLGRGKVARLQGYKVVRLQGGKESCRVLVSVSGNIGDDVILNWTESDYTDLFGGKSGWEVELSLAIGHNSLPESIFLEKPSGDSIVDSRVVRALSRSDLWQNVLPGYGTVLISFSPKVK